MEPFELKGYWWLPKHPSVKVSGTLHFHPTEGTFLVTEANSFIEPLTNEYGVKESVDGWTMLPARIVVDVICGQTTSNQKVSLYKCATQPFLTGFIIHTVFIGWHFENEDEIVFDSISLRYPHLERWVGITGFEGRFKSGKPGHFTEGDIKFALPSRITANLTEVDISLDFGFAVDSDMFTDVRMRQVTYVEVKKHCSARYTDFFDSIFHIRNFLSLGLDRAIAPTEVIGRNQGLVNTIAEGESSPQDIYIYYVAQGANLDSAKDINSHGTLFTFREIQDHLQQSLENWFLKAEKLHPIIELYFGLFYLPSIYVGLEFLILTQVLEAYHRRMYGGQYMSSEDYRNTVYPILSAAIPSELPNDHKQSLKSRVKYGYDYSLRKRIDQLLTLVLAPYQTIVKPLIGDKDRFISNLVDTRNYLTHYPEEQEQYVITDPILQGEFVEKMKLVIQLCFLLEMELPVEIASRLMKNYRKYSWFVS